MLCATNAPSLRNGTLTFTSNCEPRRVVLWKTTVRSARSVSAKGTLKMRTGRTFSTMPQSHNQTSPRLGGTFLSLVADRASADARPQTPQHPAVCRLRAEEQECA